MRKQIAAANWKMNLGFDEANKLIKDVLAANVELTNDQHAVFAVPFPYLTSIKTATDTSANYFTAAQNCASENAGAYTGETSCQMLQSIGLQYVVIGHSERREYYNETNEVLAKKINLALENNLKPIFCCGEALDIREANTQNDFVEKQLEASLYHLTNEKIQNFVIAYEPIWAIGTGKTASSAQAQDMHAHIRSTIAKKYGADTANTISILYGGSVKAANAVEIFGQPDVDGGLVGGASLVATEFVKIIKALKK
jgi:triosephosphate isomerase (TIM)